MAISNQTCTFSVNAALSCTASGAGNQPGRFGDVQSADGSPSGTVAGYATGTLAAGASVTINLYDGSLLGLDGVTAIPLRTLYYVDLWLSGAGGFLRIGASGTNAHALWFADASDASDVVAGGPPFLQGGSVGLVVDNNHKNVKIANPHGTLSATYVFRADGLLV